MQPTQPLFARATRKLALTTKMVNKGFYKGTRTGSMGWHTKHGGYRIDWNKVRTYMVPDLDEFNVRLHLYLSTLPSLLPKIRICIGSPREYPG